MLAVAPECNGDANNKKGVTAMKRQYSKPIVEKIAFNYKSQIITTSPSDCFESVMNVREDGSVQTGGPSTTCVSGIPIGVGWTEPQTLVPGN